MEAGRGRTGLRSGGFGRRGRFWRMGLREVEGVVVDVLFVL